MLDLSRLVSGKEIYALNLCHRSSWTYTEVKDNKSILVYSKFSYTYLNISQTRNYIKVTRCSILFKDTDIEDTSIEYLRIRDELLFNTKEEAQVAINWQDLQNEVEENINEET